MKDTFSRRDTLKLMANISYAKAYCPDQGGVRERRSELPKEAEADAAALGL